MELKEGYMKIKDLSVWFGLQPQTLGNSSLKGKQKKFKILESFADYHFEGRGIYIDKVKIPTYSKAYDFISEHYMEEWGKIIDKNSKKLNKTLYGQKIDTCARVGKALYKKHEEVSSQVSEKTAKAYTNAAKTQDWGKNYLKDSRGALGSCEYVLMNEEGKGPLNADQLRIVQECAKEAYSTINDQIAIYDSAYREGDMSLKERNEAVGNIDTTECYDKYLKLLLNELGFVPEKRTMLKPDKGAF